MHDTHAQGVAPALHGLGVGTLFLRLLIAEAKRQQPRGTIALDTQTLPNTRFYAKSGFVLLDEMLLQPAGPTSALAFRRWKMRLDLSTVT